MLKKEKALGLLNSLPKKKQREIVTWILISIVCLVASSAYFIQSIFFKSKQNSDLKGDLYSLVESLGSFEKKQSDKKKLQTLLKEVEEAEHNLSYYKINGAKLPVTILDGVRFAMPDEAFLKQLFLKDSCVELIGYSDSIFTTTELLDNLSELSFAKDLKLVKLEQSELEEFPLQFKISIQLKEF